MASRSQIRDAAITALVGAGLPAVVDSPASVETFPETRVGTPDDTVTEDIGVTVYRTLALEVTHYERAGVATLAQLEAAAELAATTLLNDTALRALTLTIIELRIITDLTDSLQLEAGTMTQFFEVEFLRDR